MKGDNESRISFERYILIEYLEQIVQIANERLRKLSNGQFYLKRSERVEKRNRQSGLGLDVYDAYTGQTRDVKHYPAERNLMHHFASTRNGRCHSSI